MKWKATAVGKRRNQPALDSMLDDVFEFLKTTRSPVGSILVFFAPVLIRYPLKIVAHLPTTENTARRPKISPFG